MAHLQQVEPSAAASAGTIKVVRKDAVLELWARTGTLLRAYADDWSADKPQARLLAADRIAPRLPPTGWLDRALTGEGLFVEAGTLLAEWPKQPRGTRRGVARRRGGRALGRSLGTPP